MPLILVETDKPAEVTISCETGSATITPIAAGSAFFVARELLKRLTSAEIHDLKLNHLGPIHRHVSQMEQLAQAAAQEGYVLEDRFGRAEPVVVPITEARS